MSIFDRLSRWTNPSWRNRELAEGNKPRSAGPRQRVEAPQQAPARVESTTQVASRVAAFKQPETPPVKLLPADVRGLPDSYAKYAEHLLDTLPRHKSGDGTQSASELDRARAVSYARWALQFGLPVTSSGRLVKEALPKGFVADLEGKPSGFSWEAFYAWQGKRETGEDFPYLKQRYLLGLPPPNQPMSQKNFANLVDREGWKAVASKLDLSDAKSLAETSKKTDKPLTLAQAEEILPPPKKTEKEPTGRTTYTTADGKPLTKEQERELAVAFEEHGLVEEGRKAERAGEEKAAKEAAEKFRLANVTLKGGSVSNEDWERLPQKYQSIGLRAGLKAMQDTIEDDSKRYLKAEASLESYKSGDGYDIARYLRDEPDGEQVLLDAGFTRAAIQQSRDYNRETRGIGAKPPDRFIDSYFAERGWTDRNIHRGIATTKEVRQADAHLAEASEAYQKTYGPKVSLDQFVESYFQDRGWDIDRGKIALQNKADKLIRKDLQAYDEKLLEASGAYREAYGTGAQVLSGLAKAGYLIPAARVIAPETELKDITPVEWAITAAQVALIAAPYAGRAIGGIGGAVVSRGTTAAAGAIFTKSTIDDWSRMNTVERGIAVGIDTLLIASATRGAGKLLQPVSESAARQAELFTKGLPDKISGIHATVNARNPRIAQALRQISDGIKAGDTKLIKTGARNLQIAGNATPAGLGGDVLKLKAAEIKANAQKLATSKAPPGIDRGIEANKQFIKNAEDQLKRIKNPETQRKVQTAIKEAKKQVEIATKERTAIKAPRRTVIYEGQGGKVAKTSRELVTTKAKPGAKASPRTASKTSPFIAPRIGSRVSYQPGERVFVNAVASTATKISIGGKTYTVADTETLTSTRLKETTKQREKTKEKERVKVAPYPSTAEETRTQLKTSPATRTATQPQVKPQLKTEPRTQFKTEPQFRTKQGIKTGEKTTTTPPIPGVKRDASGKIVEVPPGSVAWAQGSLSGKRLWYVLTPPYDSEHLLRIRGKLPKGASASANQKGAYATIQKTSGGKTPTRSIDMGIQDVVVTETAGGKPRITFSRDQKQRTTSQLTVSRRGGMSRTRYPSRKVGKIYHTRVGSGTVLSRRPLGRRRK